MTIRGIRRARVTTTGVALAASAFLLAGCPGGDDDGDSPSMEQEEDGGEGEDDD
ncbi:hypothetical protein [Puerhibacterium sp. TATVAM-FAB25]|uniref:hypothetical protein n=1 Tax=Puerhibacterium sp. TATVAM-FAB25 TaxID=3093699 RepID=UPI00397B655E